MVVRIGFAAALALTIAGAFVNFRVLVGAHVLVRDRAKAAGVLHQVGFGLGVLEVEQRVVRVRIGRLVGGGFGLGHGG